MSEEPRECGGLTRLPTEAVTTPGGEEDEDTSGELVLIAGMIPGRIQMVVIETIENRSTTTCLNIQVEPPQKVSPNRDIHRRRDP